jgi:hypothetical protein
MGPKAISGGTRSALDSEGEHATIQGPSLDRRLARFGIFQPLSWGECDRGAIAITA